MSRCFISSDALLDHWQGHRRLTRRVIEAFPEDRLFTFSIGGMRTFGEIAGEVALMAEPMIHGMVTDEWSAEMETPKDRASLLSKWDRTTESLEELWKKIPQGRFEETFTSFGQYTGTGYWQVLYLVDNEVHHRGQGYVYLRALGIQPPFFWEREE